MPPRILILSASVGNGHVRAAEAVEAALRARLPEGVVRHLDVLTLSNAAFRRLYAQTYLDLVNKAPHFLGYFYDLLDRPSRSGRHRGDRFRLLLEKFNLRAFLRLLREQTWDLAINTHFLPAELIAALRRKRQLHLPQLTVTTDFETHRLWVNQPCEGYCTATEEGALYLQAWGVPAETTHVTGIPIHPLFAKDKPRNLCRMRQGLVGDRPVVLQMAGGFGVGPLVPLHQALLAVTHPLEVVVVTGRNPTLREQLAAVPVPDRHRRHLLGFTDQIDELMAAADLLISKPGGLTTAEALARGLPLMVVNPIPGQESRNSDYLLENGAALKANNPPLLTYKLNTLLSHPRRLEQLRHNARRLGRPHAAFAVVEHALRLLPANAVSPPQSMPESTPRNTPGSNRKEKPR